MHDNVRGTLQLGLAGAGSLRWAVVEITPIVEALRLRRDLSPVAAAAVGQMMAGGAMVLRMVTKQPAQLLLEARGDGPLGRVQAEVDSHGGLLGMVEQPLAENPTEEEDRLAVRSALGRGTLRVVRLHTEGRRYESQVELVPGGVGQNIAHYLKQSQQIHSAVLLGVLAKPRGITAAGGILVEALPGADEDLLEQVEERIGALGGVSRLLEESRVEGLLDAVLGNLDREVLEEAPLRWICRCDRERFLEQLLSLPVGDREYLLEEGEPVRTQCTFCGTDYVFAPEELSLPQ